MSDSPDSPSGPESPDPFEIAVRGYNRSQVDEFATRVRRRVRELEGRLARALGEAEQLGAELAAARQQPVAKPAHEEISERIAQILKLADEEAQEQRRRATKEITGLRSQAQREADTLREETRNQAEQILGSARDEADRAVAIARSHAEAMTSTARAQSERMASEAHREAEASLGEAAATARRVMEEATARADAINLGADRRLTELTAMHSTSMQRLIDIRDVVTGMVARDTARGSLSDEVASVAATALAMRSGTGQADAAGSSEEAAGTEASPGADASADRLAKEGSAKD